METLISNLVARPRRETRGGREYLVAPASLIVPGVLSGSQGSLYYPPDEVAKNASDWNGMPLLVYHPVKNGMNVSGRDPDILERSEIGRNFRTYSDDKGLLKSEAWFDIEATRRVEPSILTRLEKGEPIELSTGLYTTNEPVEGEFNGKKYTHIARNYKPDHIAILPDQIGACSIKDGCGVLVNKHSLPPLHPTCCPTHPGSSPTPPAANAAYPDKCSACGGAVDPQTGKCKECGHQNMMMMESKDVSPEMMGTGMGPDMMGNAEVITNSLIEELKGLIGVNVLDQVKARVVGFFTKNARESVRNDGVGTEKSPAHLDPQSGALVLSPEDLELGKDAETQKEEEGKNPPNWAVDEAKWEKAKAAADKGGYSGDTYWAVVARIYQNMGGTIKGKTNNAFCPTGEGGGVDPTCSPTHGGTPHEGLHAKDSIGYQRTIHDRGDQGGGGLHFTVGSEVRDLYGKTGTVTGRPYHGSFITVKYEDGSTKDWAHSNLEMVKQHKKPPSKGEIKKQRKAAYKGVMGNVATKTEGEDVLSASDYAYVPDPEKPSTWKLRIDDAQHVGAAIAAIGKGFRGQKVDIPSDDLARVKAKLRTAWNKYHDENTEEMPEVIRNNSTTTSTATSTVTANGILTPEGDSAMKLSTNARAAIVYFLTTNCDCWKGEKDEEVLNGLSDDKLIQLKEHAEKSKSHEAVVNAATKPFKVPGIEDKTFVYNNEGELVCNEMSPEELARCQKMMGASGGAVKNARPTTLEEWMADPSVPREVKEWVENAKVVNQREKDAIISRLVANMDGQQRQYMISQLQKEPVGKLKDMLLFLPPAQTQPSYNQYNPQPGFSQVGANYAGSGAGPVTHMEPDDADDVLPSPVYNWKEIAAEGRHRKTG